MKKFALLNNTVNQYHHGCELVVAQIEKHLSERGAHVYVSSHEGVDWSKNDRIMKRISHCDGIIVNGEGTIHHGRKGGLRLLQVADLAQDLDIPCFLINTTYDANPPEFAVYLRKFSGIFVRESFSQETLNQQGINSELVPDLTLSSCLDQTALANRDGVGVTDSSMAPLAIELFDLAQSNGFEFLPAVRATKNEGKFHLIEALRLVKFRTFLTLNSKSQSRDYLELRRFYMRGSIKSYATALAARKLVISGRFHADCFCLLTKTPFVALDGNSHKVRSMIQDAGLDSRRLIGQESLSNFELNAAHWAYSDNEMKSIEEYLQVARTNAAACFDRITESI